MATAIATATAATAVAKSGNCGECNTAIACAACAARLKDGKQPECKTHHCALCDTGPYCEHDITAHAPFTCSVCDLELCGTQRDLAECDDEDGAEHKKFAAKCEITCINCLLAEYLTPS